MSKKFSNGSERCGEIRVTIEHEENVTELRQSLSQGAPGAEELGTIEGILELNTKPMAVAKFRPDLFAQVSQAKDGSSNSLLPQELELMSKEGLTRHGHQHLPNCFGYRSKPGRQAAGQNRNRNVHKVR